MKRSYKFVREKSSGDLRTDVITTTNLILLGGSTIASQFSSIAAVAFATLAKSMNSKPIIDMTVYEYLFGYKDSIATFGSKILPTLVEFEQFGFLDQIIKAEENHLVTLNLKEIIKEPAVKEQTENWDPQKTKKTYEKIAEKLDVEYEEDFEDSVGDDLTKYEKELTNQQEISSQSPPPPLLQNISSIKLRDFSILLWNGTPLLPDWKNSSKNKLYK